MIIGVYHLMSHCILQMPLIPHLVGTYLNTVFRVEPSRLPLCASPTMDVVTGNIPAELIDVLAQECDNRTFFPPMLASREEATCNYRRKHTVFHKKIPLILAFLAIRGLVPDIPRDSILFHSLISHLPGEDREDILPLRPRIISRDKPRARLLSTTFMRDIRPRCLLIRHL